MTNHMDQGRACGTRMARTVEQTSVSPRKRPRQARSIVLVDAILEASTRILEQHGLDALNTNAVAEKAGVSIGSLYQYFPNRDAILVALLAQFESRMRERMEATLIDAPADLESRLQALVLTAIRHHCASRQATLILETQERCLALAITDQLDEAEASMSALIRSVVANHIDGDAYEIDLRTREVELIGRTLIDDAVAREAEPEKMTTRIVTILRSCIEAPACRENDRN